MATCGSPGIPRRRCARRPHRATCARTYGLAAWLCAPPSASTRRARPRRRTPLPDWSSPGGRWRAAPWLPPPTGRRPPSERWPPRCFHPTARWRLNPSSPRGQAAASCRRSRRSCLRARSHPNRPRLPRRPTSRRLPAKRLPSARLRRTTHPIGPSRPIPRCPRSRSRRHQSRLPPPPPRPPRDPPPPPPPPPQQPGPPGEPPVWNPGEPAPAEPLGTGVATVETPAAVPTPAPVPRAPISAPARKPSVPRPPSRGVPSGRPPWLVPAAVAVVIVILLGAVGVIVLANRGGGPITGGVHATPTASANPSGSPRTSPSASATTKAPQAVPNFGATSADPITKVQICSPDSPCNIPGASPESATACELTSCRLEVAFYFSAVQKSVPYSYTVKFFDRCTGQTTDLPGPSATTPASGYIVAIATDHWTVNIPSGVKSGAIVAVASKPAVARSEPLLLGAETC